MNEEEEGRKEGVKKVIDEDTFLEDISADVP